MKFRKNFLLLLIIITLISIPLTLYLAVTSQILFRQASTSISASFSPDIIAPTIGKTTSTTITLSAGDLGIKDATIALVYDTAAIHIDGITVADPYHYVGGNPSTESITSFAAILNDSIQTIPTGDIHIATITITILTNTAATISINKTTSTATSIIAATGETTILQIDLQKPLKIENLPMLCRINQCMEKNTITLRHAPVGTNGYVIDTRWPIPQGNPPPTYYFKIFRNIGSPVPSTHPNEYYIATTTNTRFSDTNNGLLFDPGTTVYYDIDQYTQCDTAQ